MDDSLHAARQGDLILHPPLMAELVSSLTEAVVYAAATAAVAAAIGGAVVAVVGTGGAAAALTPLIAGALVGAAAMLPGGEDKSIGDHISDFSSWVGNSIFPPEPYGAIETGSGNTRINGIAAARAAGISTGPAVATPPAEEPSILQNVGAYAMLGASMMLPIIGLAQEINGIFNPPVSKAADPGTQPASHDKATCSKHPPMPEQFVAQGSDKVFINGQPAARVGDRTTCDAPIGMTFSPNVRIGGGTLTVRDIHDGKSALAKVIGLIAGMLIARRGRVRARPGKAPGPRSKIPRCKGHPVVVSTGGKLLDGPQETDFSLPGLLPIDWSRRYDSTDLRCDGLLGKGWSVPYEAEIQRVAHPQGGELWIYVDEQGCRLELGRLQVGSAFVSTLDGLAFFHQEHGITVVEDIYSGRYQVFSIDPLDARRSRLVQIGDRNLNRVDLLHDARGRLQYLVDTVGRSVAELCYDPLRPRRVAEVRRLYLREGSAFDVLRHETLVSYRYCDTGQLAEVLDALGRSVRRFTYTAEGYMASQTLPSGGVFHYQWQRFATPVPPADAGMPALLEPQPEHEWRVVRHWGENAERYDFEYDLDAGRTRVVDGLGRTELFEWDSQYQIHAYTAANGECWRETLRNGQLIESHDPHGNTWRYSYDPLGRLIASEDPLGRTQTLSYLDHWALPTCVTDGAGHSRRYRYDSHGNLLEATDPQGQATRYQYDAGGRVVCITDPMGKTRHLHWNDQARLLSYRDCSGMQTSYRYDARGNLQQSTDAEGAMTRFEYDICANLTAVVHPDGRVERYVFDAGGQLTARSDPAGQVTQWHYDSCGRLQSRTDAMGNALRYAYDAYGRLLALTNENGEHYRFEWDDLDRLLAQQHLDGSGTSYHYATNGELTLTRHPAPGDDAAHPVPLQVQHFVRDAVGRLVSKTTADGITQYAYDSADNLLSVRFTGTQGQVEEVAFGYDSLGRIIRESSSSGSLQLERDELGHLCSVVLDDQRRINYLYYGSGHLHQINLDGRVVSDFERNGLHAEVVRSQGRLTSHTRYDSGRRVVRRAVHSEDASEVALALLQKDYRYDDAGNLAAEIVTPAPPGPGPSAQGAHTRWHRLSPDAQHGRHYHHGPTERLHGVTHTGGHAAQAVETYGYDKAGNLLDAYPTHRSVKHDRLCQHEEKHYRYDRFGRLAEKRNANLLTQCFEYDAEDRLIRIRQQRGPIRERVEFSYDPLGRRTSKTLYREGIEQPISHTRFQWQGMRLLQEIRDNRPSLYLYTDAYGHVPLARADGTIGEERLRYFHTNLSGLPEQLSDEDGTLLWQCRYRAWGSAVEEVFEADEQQQQNLRYQGQYLDRETGLHYNTFRYYDPDIGRFTQPDPIGLAGGTNLYRYAPNPLLWIDPFGWMPFWKPLKHDGMGHHPFPRGHAEDHGFSELSSKWDSPSWYPNEVDGSDKLHENFHKAIAKEEVPFSRKFKGTTADLLSKIDKAYKPFTEKGFLKIPRTGEILAKDVTIGEAFRKIIGSSKTPGCDL